MSVIIGLVPGNRGGSEVVPAGWADGTGVPGTERDGATPNLAGTIATPDTTDLPDAASTAPLRNFMDLFYFRVWSIPRVLDAQNPQINSPIPFRLWNSYLVPNTLDALTSTGADGLEISIAEEDTLGALELRMVTVTITEDAPYQIDATFNFDFSLGGTALRFLAQLADILPIEADSGIIERFEWLSDILPSYDGTEQRIALRGRPRRSLVVKLTLQDDADRKALYDKLYATIAQSVIVPAYQYQSQLKVSTVIGDNKIYCNPRRADLRAGESVILVTRDGTFFYYKVDQVFADHVTISTAFSQVIPKRGTKVVGGFTGRMPDGTSIGMNALGGQATITVNILDSREQIAYPDWSSTLPTMKGRPMLLRRPMANAEAAEAFGAGLEVIDNQTGKPAQYTAWDQRYLSGARSYLVNSLLDQEEVQYWRTFLDYTRGQQRPFYTPTYRQDLVQVPGTDFLVSQVEVEGAEYANLYVGSPTYQQLELETSVGTFQVEVANVENNGTSTTINFASPIDADLTEATISRISYLMLVRLGSDTVTLTHENTYSTVDLVLRAIKV